ncbi:asparaginase [Neobacillus mesonae]|uniref:asparaginase n=1 Tax=Neobacillus mesonae TaxID=1193713 RepID=UPI00203CB1E6|nr:asparaginase [Neobacillus mesonae]MCM3568481.1 asparaginase [Neobacillus mesonae]
MKKIILLTTGGTIASRRNPETGLLSSGVITGEELSQMCDLPDSINLTVQSVLQIPSNQMNGNRLYKLKHTIEEIFQNVDVDGVVITHGTDTLEETAYFLDLTIEDDRPVVITGSQRGPEELGTDAFVNIRQAILTAVSPKAKKIGTLVLFNERIFSARYIKKVHASNVAGFFSEGYGYLGIVDQEHVSIYQRPCLRESYSISNSFPLVDIIPSYLGSDGRLLQASISSGARGIILEGSGRGHVSPELVPFVEEAGKKGIPVVITTRADEGEVRHVYDFPGSVYDLTNRGVIVGKDYDSKKARIKLAVLLAANKQIEEIKESFLI